MSILLHGATHGKRNRNKRSRTSKKFLNPTSTMKRSPSPRNRVFASWMGLWTVCQYSAVSSRFRLAFAIRLIDDHSFTGSGSDGIGPFKVVGKIQDSEQFQDQVYVTFRQEYPNSRDRCYRGTMDPGSGTIDGFWGHRVERGPSFKCKVLFTWIGVASLLARVRRSRNLKQKSRTSALVCCRISGQAAFVDLELLQR
jgi:hypothetical protein